jgi:hypothetical protein
MRIFVTLGHNFLKEREPMRKFLLLSAAALLVLSAWLWRMPPAHALTAAPPPTATQPAPPDCFGTWLKCVAGAFQELNCCTNPKATGCAIAFLAPAQPLSCRAQFRLDLEDCDEAFISCLGGGPAPAPSAVPSPEQAD